MAITDPPALGTILGVWAHPDDETFLSSALMAAAARGGARVVCVTATRGEEGSMDPARWPPERMGAVREAEMERCMAVLGIEDHRWLDHHDGRCHEVPEEEGVAQVLALLEEVRPDSVLTFGPDGLTGHLDHRTISRWTTEAFTRAAQPGARLYYATQTPAWAERWLPRLEPHNVFAPGMPPTTPEEDLAIRFALDDELGDLKFRAIRAHESQVEGLIATLGEDGMREAHMVEVFRAASTV